MSAPHYMEEGTKGMAEKSLVEQLREKSALRVEEIPNVPRWDIPARIREISAGARRQIVKDCTDDEGETDNFEIALRMVAQCLIDPPLTLAEIRALVTGDDVSTEPVDFLAEHIQKLSKTDTKSDKALARSFQPEVRGQDD